MTRESRPRVRKTRPQRHEQVCLDCDGLGVTPSEDHDEHGVRIVNVRCEGCCGCGLLVDCERCDEPIPLSLAEEGSGYCGPCRADLEMGDAAAEIARVRRWA